MNTANFPLTSVQREIWFDQIKHPETSIYTIGGYIQINGYLDTHQFRMAIQHVVDSNDAFRTVFCSTDSIPVQSFSENLHYDTPLIDCSKNDHPFDFAIAWMKQSFLKPFQSDHPPLFEFALLKISQHLYFWFIKIHHLIADGWSISICVQQVAHAYTSIQQNMKLEQNTFSYKTFIQDDQKYIHSEKFSFDRHYWQSVFPALPEPLFKNAFKSSCIKTDTKTYYINRSLYEHISNTARHMNQTIFRFFVAALYIYYSRTTQNKEFVIGIPILNRSSDKFKQTMGLFVGVMPAKFSFGLDIAVKPLLEAIQKTFRSHFNHQRLPLSEINRVINNYQQMPLFDMMLSFEKHNYSVNFNGVPANAHTLLSQYHNTPITIFIREYSRDLDVQLDICYHQSLFTSLDIDYFKDRFMTLLNEMCTFIDKPVTQLNIMPDWERCHVIEKFNNTHTFFTPNLSLHQLFEQQTQVTPNHIAVVCHTQSLTFKELNIRANQVAFDLQKNGIGAESCIGVFTTRSIEMIIGIFGILKSGGGFVPIDPDNPDDRISYIIKDAGIHIVLTQKHVTNRMANHNVKCIELEQYLSSSMITTHTPKEYSSSQHIAYILYTSGTTAQPNGVVIEHGALMNLFWGLNETLYSQFSQPCRVALNGPISFDTSIKQIIQIAGGHALYIVPESVRLHPTLFNQFIKHHAIDTIDCTPSQLDVFLGETSDEELNYSLTVLVGGEIIKPALWNRLCQLKQWTAYNLYGPTECTVDSTICLINHLNESPSIGKPLPNIQVYILDDNLLPVPIGVQGEIYIAGKNLAREYLNQPELTNQRFLLLNINTQKSIRVFKTGDMAKFSSDGTIVYLGRNDHQVKMRGHRIALEEIEQTLSCHPLVKNGVAHVHNDNLFIYVVLFKHSLESPEWSIISFLKKSLPEYMIPVSVIVLDRLPLTKNGKINRHALPSPQMTIQTNQCIPAKNPFDMLVASIWSDILNYHPASMSDHFFEKGGHSLAAMRFVSQVNKRLCLQMTIKDIFDHPILNSLCQLLQRKPQSPLSTIQNQPDQDHYIASFSQHRIWLLDQFDDSHTAYHIAGGFQIIGTLNKLSLTQSFEYLIKRHESLRTGFQTINGELRQVIVPHVDFIIEWKSFVHHSNPKEMAWQYAQTVAQKPFDLSTPPLLKVLVLNIDENTAIFVIIIHHIISDGWSIRVLIRELETCYKAFALGQNPELPQLKIHYKDFTVWQNNLLKTSFGQSLQKFWHKQLAGELPVVTIPTDFSRPKHSTNEGCYLEFTIPQPLIKKLIQLYQVQNVSLFSVIIALINVLLYRYTGETDIIIGTPVAGRNHADLDNQIGCYLNTVVLRNTVEPEQSFISFLQTVGKNTIKAISNQYYPFDQLVTECLTHRIHNRHPFFDIMVSEILVDEQSLIQFQDLRIKAMERLHPVSLFDLVFSFTLQKMDIRFGILYKTQLFKEETIHRMWQHIVTLMQHVVDQPNTPINKLNVLTKQEKHKILYQWNNTQSLFPNDKTFDQLFEEQAAKTPLALSVIDSRHSLTYEQLNQKANDVAHVLRHSGVEPESIVALCMDRSVYSIIAMLGILKAGGVYLPLDPDYPNNRLNFILNDTDARFLFIQKQYLLKFSDYQHTIICIEDLKPNNTQITKKLPSLIKHSHQTAYIIYTSGSTGVPKGIRIKHFGLCNLVNVEIKRLYLSSMSRVLQFSSLAFDASIMEITMALGAGGGLFIAAENDRIPGDGLISFINKYQLTHILLPPSVLSFLPETTLPSVQVLILGGEHCPIRLAQKWSHNRKVINAYGPSEATVFVSTGQYDAENDEFPIGTPIDNMQLYILDKHLNPAPIGISGEIYISGVGLGDYINQPEVTQKMFYPHPFSNNPMDRLYKTGDMGRYLSNGSIEYVGRDDHQIKLRGIRIETKEIESVLHHHGDIQECVILVKGQDLTHKQLVAYIVFKQGIKPNIKGLIDYLKNNIPNYMVPSVIIPLDTLPKTRTGKLDIKALPQGERVSLKNKYVPATHQIETKLVQLWEKILDRHPIGVMDDFFELGGHSLLAIKLISQIHDMFKIDIGVKIIFQKPTILEIAREIMSCINNGNINHGNDTSQNLEAIDYKIDQCILVPIQTKGKKNPIFCVHAIEGLIFSYRILSHYLSDNHPVYAFQAEGIAIKQNKQKSINQIACQYNELIKQMYSKGPLAIIGLSFGGVVSFEMACQLQNQGYHVQLIMIDSPKPGTDISLDDVFKTELFNTIADHIIDKNQLMRVIDLHLAALKAYKPSTYYEGKIVYLNSIEDKTNKCDIHTYWQQMSSDGIEIIDIPGDHANALRLPNVIQVSDIIMGILHYDSKT